MNAGTFLAADLSPVQRQQMRDWFLGHLVRLQSDDKWVVAQDPCDGNNGIHQMEHNGRGAYPAWPYHDGWALKALRYPRDTVALLRLIAGVPAAGAVGQGCSFKICASGLSGTACAANPRATNDPVSNACVAKTRKR